MRVPPGQRQAQVLALYQSGEIARLITEHKTQGAVAAVIGMTTDALANATGKLARAGKLPKWSELINSSTRRVSTSTQSGQADTQGGRDKWPNVAAFDALEPAVPVGHIIRGVSTLLDHEGNARAQWIKTRADDDDLRIWLEALRNIGDDIQRIEPAPSPSTNRDDLLACYAVGDPHFGALAWHEDSGENFDLAIAERNLTAAFEHLINVSPACAQALMIFIGDNTHSDGQSNTTTRGTRVDVDGRTVNVVRATVRAFRRAIDLSLRKHDRTHVIVERGNHDELLSAMIAIALSLAYESEPRVYIDVSPEMFHWFRFGANLIGTHHGDKVKPIDLLGVMAVDRQKDWGETKHRRFYCGHLHHLMTKEVPGLIIETLPTLAASDAWHRAMGYRSQRAMYMDVLHRERGHVNRHIVGIEQITDGT